MISKKKTQSLTRKGAILASLNILTIASAAPVLASMWRANAPDSIQIKSGDISYTMAFCDTNDVKDNNISDNQVNGKLNDIGNSGSNDSGTFGKKPTNPSKPEDKWKDLIFQMIKEFIADVENSTTNRVNTI